MSNSDSPVAFRNRANTVEGSTSKPWSAEGSIDGANKGPVAPRRPPARVKKLASKSSTLQLPPIRGGATGASSESLGQGYPDGVRGQQTRAGSVPPTPPATGLVTITIFSLFAFSGLKVSCEQAKQHLMQALKFDILKKTQGLKNSKLKEKTQ